VLVGSSDLRRTSVRARYSEAGPLCRPDLVGFASDELAEELRERDASSVGLPLEEGEILSVGRQCGATNHHASDASIADGHRRASLLREAAESGATCVTNAEGGGVGKSLKAMLCGRWRLVGAPVSVCGGWR